MGVAEEPDRNLQIVAEPVGAQAYTAEGGEWKIDSPTVNWPSFRGQNALGIGDGKDALTDWNLDSGEGVAWQTDLSGLGNSSPVVWGDQVFVTTASVKGEQTGIRTGLTGAGDSIDEEVEHTWIVVSHDKKTGKEIPILLFGAGVSLDPRFDPKLAEALRYGVNYIDAADCYGGGSCEPAVGSFHKTANLRDVIQDSGRRQDLDETERELIENVMDFRDVDVAAIMTQGRVTRVGTRTDVADELSDAYLGGSS